jgi:hypothetical protein
MFGASRMLVLNYLFGFILYDSLISTNSVDLVEF